MPSADCGGEDNRCNQSDGTRRGRFVGIGTAGGSVGHCAHPERDLGVVAPRPCDHVKVPFDDSFQNLQQLLNLSGDNGHA